MTREPAEVRTQAVLSVVVGRVCSMVPPHPQPGPQQQQLKYTSPRLVSYFSKVFKRASTQTVTELHNGKDERRTTMLHLPLSMRRNNRDYRQKMGPMCTSPTRKRRNPPVQQAGRKTSGNN